MNNICLNKAGSSHLAAWSMTSVNCLTKSFGTNKSSSSSSIESSNRMCAGMAMRRFQRCQTGPGSLLFGHSLFTIKLQPAIFPLSQHVIRFTNYQPIQRNASYNMAVRIMHIYCIMQHGYYVSNTIYQYFS